MQLEAIRREIDALDTELLTLLNRRAAAALEVAAVKGRLAESRYYRPEREATLLRRLVAGNTGPLPDAEVTRLFREIVSTCRALEQRPAIACVKVAGVRAVLGHFGGAVDFHVAADVAGALTAVAATAPVASTSAVAAPPAAAAGEAATVAQSAPRSAEGWGRGAAAAGEAATVTQASAPAVDAPAAPDIRCDYAMIEFSPGGEADPAVADLAGAGLVLCGEWYATSGASGERYVVIGREPVPLTGDDWTSLVVAGDRMAGLESRCAALDLAVRSTPISGRASFIADVAAHTRDPGLAGLLAEYGGERAVLGAYPNAR